MDSAIKTLINLFFIAAGVFLLVSIITFAIVVNNARSVLYNVIEYVEISGFDADVISDYADETKTQIEVTPTEDGTIYESGEDKQRYNVEVTFSHTLAWIRFSPTITIKGTTRAVEY